MSDTREFRLMKDGQSGFWSCTMEDGGDTGRSSFSTRAVKFGADIE